MIYSRSTLPTEFKFLRPLYHPNIYPDGRLCISILHTPGNDETSGELASERWSPVQRVETVMLSILSLLDDANSSSPANVDASVMLREKPAQYKARVTVDVDASKEDIPEDFTMPTHESVMGRRVVSKEMEEDDFWADSGDEAEDDDEDGDMFGGSDSDAEMTMDDEDGDADSGSEDEEEDEEGKKE
jgi:ubiquitin-conjugating enzyme E2 R